MFVIKFNFFFSIKSKQVDIKWKFNKIKGFIREGQKAKLFTCVSLDVTFFMFIVGA